MFVIEEHNFATRETTLHVEYEHFTDAVPAFLALLGSHDIIDTQRETLRTGQELREHGHYEKVAGTYGLSITKTETGRTSDH
jgi:hypothetical protein